MSINAYGYFINYGHDSISLGDYGEAIESFSNAFIIAMRDEDGAAALYGKGVALRLNGQLDKARITFESAVDLASDESSIAIINRELGMCYLDSGVAMTSCDEAKSEMYNQAEKLLVSSRDSLRCLGEYTEAAISDSFLAQLYYLTGRRADAVRVFCWANEVLRNKNAAYELNNLMWLARISLHGRWQYAYRAMYLAVKVSATHHLKEYILILLGGNFLYEKLRT